MEKAWFIVPRGKRETAMFRQLRSAIAAAGGQELREDVLERMGVNVFNLRSAVKGGDYKEISKKFAAGGDHMRADDVFLPDSYGDHMLDTREAWDNFEKLVTELDSHGERLEMRHFLQKNHECKSALEEALIVNQARKIFTAKVWRGRMPEMLALYEHIPMEKRKDVPLDDVLKELEEDIFGSKIDIAPGLAKGALTALMNDAAQPDTAGLSAVRGIGLKKIWENISDVRRLLRDAGEALTIDDLRLTSGHQAESAMLTAARHGKFAEVIAMLGERNDEFAVEDLAARGKAGKSIIEILAEKKQLDLVCRAEFWAHRPQDFQKLWKAVPEKSRDQINYQDLLSRMNLISLRARFSAGGPQPAL